MKVSLVYSTFCLFYSLLLPNSHVVGFPSSISDQHNWKMGLQRTQFYPILSPFEGSQLYDQSQVETMFNITKYSLLRNIHVRVGFILFSYVKDSERLGFYIGDVAIGEYFGKPLVGGWEKYK